MKKIILTALAVLLVSGCYNTTSYEWYEAEKVCKQNGGVYYYEDAYWPYWSLTDPESK